MFVKGRLREDVPTARAAASLGAIMADLSAAYPESNTEWSAFHGASVGAPGSAAWQGIAVYSATCIQSCMAPDACGS